MRTSALLSTLFLLAGCGGRVGDLAVCDPTVLGGGDQVAFARLAWQRAGPEERGRMVIDLARSHQLAGVAPAEVRGLLGDHTCYVNYDSEPCYEVTLGGRRQYLAFPVAHSGARQGKVMAAYLRSDASALSGCLYE